MLTRLAAIALFSFAPLLFAADPPVLTGPARDVALIADFTPDLQSLWQPRGGQNLTWNLQSGYTIPAVANTLLRIDLQRKDADDKEPGHNWFGVQCKDLSPELFFHDDLDGLRICIGSQFPAQWWVHVELTTEDGQQYGNVIADHAFPPGRIVDYLVPLERFKTKSGQSLTPALAKQIRGIGFVLGGGGPGTELRTFYIDRISAYRVSRYDHWVTFSTSQPSNNLFYRDQPVAITFTPGKRPAGAQSLQYIIRDHAGTTVREGTVPLPEADAVTIPLAPLPDGYYETAAFFADAAGRRLSDASCIRPEGTQPDGIGTFAILPSTEQEMIARRKAVGQDAFFGLHGDFLGIADHLGASWRLEYTHWRYLEFERPDRSKGDPEWVAKRLAESPRPAWQYNFTPFVFNIRSGLPEWAASTGPAAPAFKSWEDALAVVRDFARTMKHLYPHQSPRIYGAGWEINLNMQPYISQQPEYQPEDVVELYRRVREVVKAEDPGALIAGPNPSTLNLDWYERMFRAGILQYLDAIETHAYDEGVFTAEQNDTAGKIARLNDLIRRYNNGRTLPIYCTERGNFGRLGATTIPLEQAEIMVRSAIILKGEGVRVFHPFYGIDYDNNGFGFCYNLEMEGPGRPWATKRISPKPMVNAMATCIRLLEGAGPKERLRGLGEDVWAYVFASPTQQVTALWTTGGQRSVAVPVSRRSQLISMMGRTQSVEPAGGKATLTLSSAPVYLVQPLP